jgi:hypothetical protein
VTGLSGSCHCGAVRITVPRLPDYVNSCNCSVCAKLGWRCFYFGMRDVEVTGGALDSYVREDLDPICLRVLRCARCGCPTHWEPLEPEPEARMGINANLFDADVIGAVELRHIDGRSW